MGLHLLLGYDLFSIETPLPYKYLNAKEREEYNSQCYKVSFLQVEQERSAKNRGREQ